MINWGESVFIRNGLNSLNPIDVSKLRVAGAEVRDVLMPVPAVNAKAEISDSLSLEGFYQIRWAHTEIEPAGTFFSTNDVLGPGGDIAHTASVFLTVPMTGTAPGPAMSGAMLARTEGRRSRRASFGTVRRSATLFRTGVEQFRVGLYYARIHSRLPVVSLGPERRHRSPRLPAMPAR